MQWCSEWDITRSTWYNWIEAHEEFAEAVEMADIHMKARFTKNYMDVMEGTATGNAGMQVNAAKYILGWDGKPEAVKEETADIRVLNIQIMPSKPELKLITDNVIDIKVENE